MILHYPLISDSETGTFYFNTDKKIKYTCIFKNITRYLSPMLGVYDLEVYDFEFYHEGKTEEKIKFDAAIANTISDLFTTFFTSDLRVLVYICDSTDGKHKGRDELFNRWHRKFVADKLLRIPVEIELNEEITYGCLLVKKEFPYMNILNSELLQQAYEIIASKY